MSPSLPMFKAYGRSPRRITKSQKQKSIMDNTFTTEIVRGLFGPSIAPILSTCKCSYQRASGRLYIASNAMCFYSNIFGFERKILIKTMDITFAGLTRNTSIIVRSKCTGSNGGGGGNNHNSVNSNSGIQSSNSMISNGERKEEDASTYASNSTQEYMPILFEEEYVFKSFQERESVLRMLLDVLEKRNNPDYIQDYVFRDNTKDIVADEKNHKHNHNRQTVDTKYAIAPTSAHGNTNTTTRNFQSCVENDESTTSPRRRTYSDPATLRTDAQYGTSHKIHHSTMSITNATMPPNRLRGDSTPDWMKHQNVNSSGRNITAGDEKMATTTTTVNDRMSMSLDLSIGQYSNLIVPSQVDAVAPFHPKPLSATKPKPKQKKAVKVTKPTKRIPTFEEEKAKFEKSYPHSIINSQRIPNYTLEEFYKTFLDGNGSHSLEVFHDEIIGDKNINFSNWNLIDDDNTATRTLEQEEEEEEESTLSLLRYKQQKRSISFLHPRNAKLGPSTVPTKRQQVCTIYPSSTGIIVSTETKLDGVPYSDCFLVEEEWVIEPCNDTNEVEFSSRYHINFVKPTMMKKIIGNQTKQELKNWYKIYLKYILSSKEEGEQQTALERNRNDASTIGENDSVLENKRGFFFFNVLISSSGSIMVFVLLVYLLYQIHSLQLKIIGMENIIHELRNDNLHIIHQIESMKEVEKMRCVS